MQHVEKLLLISLFLFIIITDYDHITSNHTYLMKIKSMELCSWLYRTVVFFLVSVLFRLICYLQILRLQDFAQVFQVDSDVEAVLREHLRIRRHLKIISHHYRALISFALIIVTVSQFAAFLDTTCKKADLSILLGINSRERMDVEQVWFGREITDIVMGEGEKRRERHERFLSWEMMMRIAGFRNIALTPFALSQAKLLLQLHYPGTVVGDSQFHSRKSQFQKAKVSR
ncbi:hypothetical protein L2E82_48170 [Cichorium intybus]|uniref:Uncharacterized protein n=1 Tax=Cichorium intybus TaxID=13427 RepID=A0ACB8YYS3_CICIN|nr:hypothetical protein L2E82_48170 [Cichorium intybus]